MSRFLYKASKKLHKIVGLVCLAWFFLLGFSGVAINHPGLIRGISVPAFFVPEELQL